MEQERSGSRDGEKRSEERQQTTGEYYSVEFMVEDERIRINSAHPVPATLCNISSSGTSLGLDSMVYVPEGAHVILRHTFKRTNELLCAACVVYSRMKEKGGFLIGMTLKEATDEVKNYLVGLTHRK